MSLDARVWCELETYGLTAEHLDLLLGLLRLGKNGCVSWHFVHGKLVQNDVRVVFSNRSYDVQRVSEVLLQEE